ncbi:MAG: hypothetical protein HOP35_00220 [Nitrospira sp.]|nr:hypothetical protein [Nitrospira sp.]
MNRTQILHRALAAGNIAVVLTGLGLEGKKGITLNVILMFFLLLIFRIKFWVDDEQYFQDVESGKLPGGTPHVIGLVIGVFSWLVWYLAGFFIKDIALSSLLMAIVMGLSFLWIVATMVSRGAYAEQVPWLFFNAFYILGFLLLFFQDRSWNPFVERREAFTTVVLCGLGVVFLFDLVVTRLLEQRRAT